MATNSSENLETDFEKLRLASKHEKSDRPRSIKDIAYLAQFATKTRLNESKRAVMSGRTRLEFDHHFRRTRTANFITRRRKKWLLKPATLILKGCEKPDSQTSAPRVPFSVNQAFSSDRLANQKTFKSLITKEATDTVTDSLDTYLALPFKNLRLTKDPPLPEISTAIKRENTSSCSVQAKTDSSVSDYCDDDTSIEELASYFELFVHIPKKMSSMAEMMYV